MITTEKIYIPEDYFSEVPKNLSSVSTITKVEVIDNTCGIILNDIKEIEGALRTYNGEKAVIPSNSTATKQDLLNNAFDLGGGMGLGLVALASRKANQGRDFVGTMVAEAKSNLAANGRYYRDYDYDGMGTNFMKTTIGVEKIEKKFVLSITAAYVGNEPEKSLAKQIGKPMVVRSVTVKASMSVVDDWWFNVNVRKILHPVLGLEENIYISLADVLCGKKENNSGLTIPYKFEEQLFNLTLGFDRDTHFNIKDEKRSRDLVRSDGVFISGAAWNAYRGKNQAATPKEVALILTFCYPTKDSFRLVKDNISPTKTKILQQVAKEAAAKLEN
jgi:hypothetical protein